MTTMNIGPAHVSIRTAETGSTADSGDTRISKAAAGRTAGTDQSGYYGKGLVDHAAKKAVALAIRSGDAPVLARHSAGTVDKAAVTPALEKMLSDQVHTAAVAGFSDAFLSGGIDHQEVADWRESVLADPAAVADINRLFAGAASAPGALSGNALLAAAGDKQFDIMRMSGFSPADLLFALVFLLADMRNIDTQFKSRMMQTASDAVQRKAASIIKEGQIKFNTAITQGVVSMGGVATSVGLKVFAQHKASQDRQFNTKATEDIKLKLNTDLAALGSVKPGPAAGVAGKTPVELTKMAVQPTGGGAPESVSVAPSNATLSAPDRARIEAQIKQKAEIAQAANAEASAANQSVISKYTMGADVLSAFTTQTSGVVGGVGNMQTSGEVAFQGVVASHSNVATGSSDASKERVQALTALILELLQALHGANQAHTSMSGIVAGNIRG